MPKPPIPADIVEMLKRPNPAVMATVRADGTPVSAATWYLWDDGRVLLNLDAGRKRLEHMRANPHVTLTVLDGESWYRTVTVQGTVTFEDDTDLVAIDRLSKHYVGSEYDNRERPRVTTWLNVDAYQVWG